MPEQATYRGLIVLAYESTILFVGQAVVLLRPRLAGAGVLRADWNRPSSSALCRLSSPPKRRGMMDA